MIFNGELGSSCQMGTLFNCAVTFASLQALATTSHSPHHLIPLLSLSFSSISSSSSASYLFYRRCEDIGLRFVPVELLDVDVFVGISTLARLG